jgi:chemotaxis protein methyltransferase WspC
MTASLGKLLEEIAGISPRVLGEKNLARAVQERMLACNLADEEQYFEHVRSSSKEMDNLIDIVVIPETYFFRDKEPFAFLGRYVRDEWARKRTSEVLRILSAPCSSGEEPYSIAIALHDAGLKPDAYRIDAVDISQALLDKAKRAVFSPHSFRGVPESLRERYFLPAGREFALIEEIRHRVHFINGNLLDKLFLPGKPPYDIIFCRNLLIYFGPEARTRLLNSIERLLARNGFLFVGHAETSSFPAAKFEPLEDRRTFGFRKVEPPAVTVGVKPQVVISSPPPLQAKPVMVREAKQPLAPPPDALNPKDTLQEAQEMADRGCLKEAMEICERLLLKDKGNSDVHCLLGIIQHGLGNLARAEECFIRAIYLDEVCYDAMIHLALIKEYQRDFTGAEVLRRRAARIHPQTGTS